MRNYPNIESMAWRRTGAGLPVYVGYGGGAIWYVSRATRKSPWHCWPQDNRSRYAPGNFATLAQVSEYLLAFDR